jgi:hypothetical protein
MSENMMNSAHKTSTPEYRSGWDRIFGKAMQCTEPVSCDYCNAPCPLKDDEEE